MHVVLLPGAGGAGWIWSRVVPLLEQAGHTAVAVDFPADDENAGLPEYVALAVEAAGDAEEVLLVAQSLGGFTAPLAAARLIESGHTPAGIVFVNAMVPEPGETPGAWWDNVGFGPAHIAAAEEGGWTTEFDLDVHFLHDVDPDIAAEGEQHQREEVDAVFASVCDLVEWPDVPTRVIIGADDRFFPLALQQRIARERLGVEPTVVPGGHLAALSQPEAVARAILMA